MERDQPNHAPTDDRFVTIEHVQQLLDVTRGTVNEWVTSGELAHYRFGPRTIRIDRADLEAFIATRRRIGDSREEAPAATTRKRSTKRAAAEAADIRSRCSSPESGGDEQNEPGVAA